MAEKNITLAEKLLNVQTVLKAPKSQYNSFGKYTYRSAEDIVEAVKPLAKAHRILLTVSDEVIETAGRIYIRRSLSRRTAARLPKLSQRRNGTRIISRKCGSRARALCLWAASGPARRSRRAA